MTEAAVPVRPAATVLLLRDAEAGLEVFMVRRHRMMGFAGDALVFPGGRLDEADAALAARTELCVLPEGLEAQAAVFRVGALRETFEESGVLLARDRSGKVLGGDRLHRFAGARASVAAGSGSFADFLARENIVLAADLLIPFAHWITPPVHAKRYDTMFFLAAAPPGQTAAHDGTESVDSLWITAADALAAAAGGAARVEFATRRNLEKLGRFPTVAAAPRGGAAGADLHRTAGDRSHRDGTHRALAAGSGLRRDPLRFHLISSARSAGHKAGRGSYNFWLSESR